MEKIKETKRCPYCGEEILAVAKKCKHCGEWIKEEDVVVGVKKKTCPVCGEEINADATVCPICHEKIEKHRNAFREKVMAERKGNFSESKRSNSVGLWVLAVVAVIAIIIVCVSVISSKESSSPREQSSNENDSIVEVEEVPIEEIPIEESYYYNDDGMIQHTEEQGKSEEDNAIHSLNEYNGY